MYLEKANKKNNKSNKKNNRKDAAGDGDDDIIPLDDDQDGAGNETKGDKRAAARTDQYYRISCRDNGCGMAHNEVPNMFGRVLAGTKYNVKQARGKFGLGAKMALIWSQKSTALPIEVTTGHSTDPNVPPKSITYCKLGIDIQKNEPKTQIHTEKPNTESWRGSIVELVIRGNWTNYRGKILQYLQQLAVITPYAEFNLDFTSEINQGRGCKRQYIRRSNELPRPAQEVNYHPKSVDNMIVTRLLHKVTASMKVESFLTRELSSINKKLAGRLMEELVGRTKGAVSKDMNCGQLVKSNHVQDLTQLLRDTTLFSPPDSTCLSPAGEYNLSLGIRKEYDPELVATATSKPSSYNGHPFIVEAALALGLKQSDKGDAKAGTVVFRFANRIPLLFSGGSDVATIVANKHIKWATYQINPKQERVGVFVSIVSTKIPFKGTGKEFIGVDVDEIRESVVSAIRSCAKQLKSKVQNRKAADERANRVKLLVKHVPDVARALTNVLDQIRNGAQKRVADAGPEGEAALKVRRLALTATGITEDPYTRILALERSLPLGRKLDDALLQERLHQAIKDADLAHANEDVKRRGRGAANNTNVYLIPERRPDHSFASSLVVHPLMTLRLLANAERKPGTSVITLS